MTQRWALPCLLVLCSVACVMPAKADDLIGNLSGGYNGVNSFSNTLGFANSFVMGGDSYLLSDIQIVMNGMPALSDPIFQLQSDDGAPDGVLLTLVNPIFFAGVQVYTFTTGTSFTLEANTTYWLTATSTSTVASHWEDSIGDVIPVGAGATYGGRDASSDGGLIWGGAPGNTDLFEVDGTMVQTTAPEPGSAGLAAIGLSLCFLAIGWKRFAGWR